MSNALVSIVIITYNAAAFVFETLESAYRQTFQNLELIIADDGSSDDTVAICEIWLAEKSSRFSSTSIIASSENSGTSVNANRGMMRAKGEWLKIIAGDDILSNDCIELNLNYVLTHAQAQVVFSNQKPFLNEYLLENIQPEKSHALEYFYRDDVSARQQFLILLFKYTVHSPTMFLSKKLFHAVRGYDEDMKIIEDIALYMKILLHGEKLYYLNANTVYYRVHQHSSSQAINLVLVQKKQEDRALRLNKYVKPNVNEFTVWLHESLMKVYFQKTFIPSKLRHRITALALVLIKAKIIK